MGCVCTLCCRNLGTGVAASAHGATQVLHYMQSNRVRLLVVGDSLQKQLHARLAHMFRGTRAPIVDYRIPAAARYSLCRAADSFAIAPGGCVEFPFVWLHDPPNQRLEVGGFASALWQSWLWHALRLPVKLLLTATSETPRVLKQPAGCTENGSRGRSRLMSVQHVPKRARYLLIGGRSACSPYVDSVVDSGTTAG